jgi:multiple antibiotic resistance protein
MEITLLLFLVIDPFGNLPFVLAVLKDLSAPAYRRAVLREILLAFGVLLLFAVAGEAILGYLRIEQSSLQISGGIILFLISLKMIFQSASELFRDRYAQNPILVPIAVPAIAGPATITTLMVLRGQQQITLLQIGAALLIVLTLTAGIFWSGRRLQAFLGQRGMAAVEKFMGLLLNLVAVNMILQGLRSYLA